VTAYVALLRAANVGGQGVMKMTGLRAAFEQLGFRDVATYIQSGNVAFTCTASDRDRLVARIAAKLAATLDYRGEVFVRTPDELRAAAAANPLDARARAATQRCHVMFLSRAPAPERVTDLIARAGDDYRVAVRDAVLYYAYPTSSIGKRRAIDFERVLGVSGTARTWNVVDALIDLASRLRRSDRQEASTWQERRPTRAPSAARARAKPKAPRRAKRARKPRAGGNQR
jgi:uncharacterized protein (DUF1697 family)